MNPQIGYPCKIPAQFLTNVLHTVCETVCTTKLWLPAGKVLVLLSGQHKMLVAVLRTLWQGLLLSVKSLCKTKLSIAQILTVNCNHWDVITDKKNCCNITVHWRTSKRREQNIQNTNKQQCAAMTVKSMKYIWQKIYKLCQQQEVYTLGY